MPPSSESSSDSSESSISDSDWTGNDGESSEYDEEAEAVPSLRGKKALVTAKCPRRYLREWRKRKANAMLIPSDMGKKAFLDSFRRVVGTCTSQKLLAATCHEDRHVRVRSSTKEREKHYHLAVKMSDNFPHKKVAEAFHKKHGVKLGFSFKFASFGEVLKYVMEKEGQGTAPEVCLDNAPAKFPARLDLQAELPAAAPQAPVGPEPDVTEPVVEEEQWTENEGESTADEEEAEAHQSVAQR